MWYLKVRNFREGLIFVNIINNLKFREKKPLACKIPVEGKSDINESIGHKFCIYKREL